MLRSILLTTALVAASAAPAFAQTPVPAPAPAPLVAAPPVPSQIVVYDFSQVIVQSVAGQDMRTKLQAIADQIQRELEPDVRQLQSELAAIQSTSVADAQSPAAQQRQQAFIRLRDQFQQKRERLGATVELTERNALSTFSQALIPVLRSAMLARNGLMVMQSNNIDVYVAGVDMTADIVTRLNATTRTINVTRATLPTQGGAPAAAPAAGSPTPVPVPSGALPRQPARPPAAPPPR